MGNEFAYGLVLGLILIVIGIVVFTTQWNFQTGSYGGYSGYADYGPNDSLINMTGSYAVGFSELNSSSFIEVGDFDVRAVREIVSTNKRIFNGLLFGSEGISIAGDVESIDIVVRNTNSYANFVVMVGDKRIVDKRLGVGRYHIDVADRGNVQVFVESSGWRLWAPAIYDVYVDAISYRTGSQKLQFNADINDLVGGEVRFYFTKSFGNAVIKFNDRVVNTQKVGDFYRLDLGKGELFATNTVVIVADRNALFEGSVEAELDYSVGKVSRVDYTFYLNESNYNSLYKRSGYVSFDIVSIEKPGGVVTKIRDKDDKSYFVRYDEANVWNYRYYLGRGDVNKGFNRLSIEATDGALFWVKNVKFVC